MSQTFKLMIQIPADLLIGATLSPAPPRAIIGQPYNYSGVISITGGVPPYLPPIIVGSATSGGLALVLNGLAVSITGTPTAVANFEIDGDDSTP